MATRPGRTSIPTFACRKDRPCLVGEIALEVDLHAWPQRRPPLFSDREDPVHRRSHHGRVVGDGRGHGPLPAIPRAPPALGVGPPLSGSWTGDRPTARGDLVVHRPSAAARAGNPRRDRRRGHRRRCHRRGRSTGTSIDPCTRWPPGRWRPTCASSKRKVGSPGRERIGSYAPCRKLRLPVIPRGPSIPSRRRRCPGSARWAVSSMTAVPARNRSSTKGWLRTAATSDFGYQLPPLFSSQVCDAPRT